MLISVELISFASGDPLRLRTVASFEQSLPNLAYVLMNLSEFFPISPETILQRDVSFLFLKLFINLGTLFAQYLLL